MAATNVMAVRNWLKSQYPNPDINPVGETAATRHTETPPDTSCALAQEWIQNTVVALAEADPSLDLRGMFFAIQTQLLLSNLAESLLPYALNPPPPGKLTTLPAEPELVHDVILFGPDKKDACLVQIISISEVGQSAFQTKNVMEQRREALSGVGRIRRIRDNIEPLNLNNATGEQQPDEEDNEPDDVPPYPRSMLMLDVSDGYRVMKAMEYRRIDALKLGETALGSKMLLRSVKVRRGTLMLTPENVDFKGHMVEEFEELQPILFQNGLLRRMGPTVIASSKPELPLELPPDPAQEQQQPDPPSEFDEILDDEFIMDEAVAQELDRVEVAAAIQASQSQSQNQAAALSKTAAAPPPTTPARLARSQGNSRVAGSAPTQSRVATAYSSSLRAAVDFIDLEDD
ncbi:hypothetical protein QFC21_000285 [Naganishia friedmannii]|uniref:Uncharacterized protein n=1 Tax=Naganishia friedmannii TaxID=89922 RepID=A0ACC2WEJ8_9TREE|nr:hypothetical protein QFC21_000285 [Naganishia friedmannii]